MPQIIVSGADVAKNPTVNSNSSAGYQGQGQITVGAQGVFQADDVIVLQINRVDGNGEISPSSNSGLSDVTVYDSYSDYLAGNVKFHYAPQSSLKAIVWGNAWRRLFPNSQSKQRSRKLLRQLLMELQANSAKLLHQKYS